MCVCVVTTSKVAVVVVVRMQLVIIRTVLKIGFDQKIICSWGVHSVQQRAAGGTIPAISGHLNGTLIRRWRGDINPLIE